MYFPRLYPDELLYSAIARCRVHLGIGSHKGLLAMLFGDTRVAAVTDLPSHLQSLAGNTGLDPETLVANHTLFPLYAPFIPKQRRFKLHQSMLAPDQPSAIGLAGASTALVKWPEWLRYCPLCFEEMVANFGEPYWRRCWQVQGVDACLEHGCLLLDSPIPFRRTHRHEFHAATLLPGGRAIPAEAALTRLATALTQLLTYRGGRSPGFSGWSNFYQRLATDCGARRGGQVMHDAIWQMIQDTHPRDWIIANGLWAAEPPLWLLALFRKHRKAFGCLQHLIVWTSLRPGHDVGGIIEEAWTCRLSMHQADQPEFLLSAEPEQRQRYRAIWTAALAAHGGPKAARQCEGQAVYAWLYRHDRGWLLATNRDRTSRKGNHGHTDWRRRDRDLVRRLIRIERDSAEKIGLPRRSRNWFLHQLPHHASVERHLAQLPLCHAFLERYAESVGEYQIRRLTRAALEDAAAGRCSKRWQLERRCGLIKGRTAPLAAAFIADMGEWD